MTAPQIIESRRRRAKALEAVEIVLQRVALLRQTMDVVALRSRAQRALAETGANVLVTTGVPLR